ncbi:MAG: HD-GYP domain-containing protein [Deinococcota bacterium]|nr:HD-GYP domain-containing protein [Deinococcota bacterium]
MPVRYGHVLEALGAVLKPAGEPSVTSALPLGELITESPDLVCGADASGRLHYLNPAGRRLLGLDGRLDLQALTLRRLFPAWVYERLETVALPAARGSGRWSGGAALLTWSGEERPVSLILLAQDDGSLALIARDQRRERRRQRTLEQLADESDDPHTLLRGLCGALGLRRAFIGEVAGAHLELVASWGDPSAEGTHYPLAGSPCEAACRGPQVYPSGLRAHFPNDERLAALGAESFMGAPLRRRDDEPVTLLVALHDAPLEDSGELALLFGAFARRAAAALAAREADSLRLERVHQELEKTREDALRAMGLALEYRDYETKGHTDRVTELSLRLGRALGLGAEALTQLRWGSYLHDAGKIAIADRILLKPGKLEADEWRTMKGHVTIGETMVGQLGFIPRAVLEIVRHHHERWDGAGYPDGLAGETIPLLARVFALADVYDALLSERPYKRAWRHEEALAEIVKGAGQGQFDPGIAAAFIRLWDGQEAAATPPGQYDSAAFPAGPDL